MRRVMVHVVASELAVGLSERGRPTLNQNSSSVEKMLQQQAAVMVRPDRKRCLRKPRCPRTPSLSAITLILFEVSSIIISPKSKAKGVTQMLANG
jgi:hypothetical protein